MKSTLPLTGRYRIRVRDADGAVVHEQSGDNLVVVDGFELAAALIVDEAVTAVSHMAAGDGTTDPDEDESALVNELERVALSSTTRNGHIIEHTAEFSGIASDIEVSEFGLFNASSAGTMFARFVTDTFTLFSGQSMDIVWEIRVGQ